MNTAITLPPALATPLAAASGYWNSYYEQQSPPSYPSQFCLFAQGEMAPGDMVLDLGCGQGRDALYLASKGVRVLGVDASEAAVLACRHEARRCGLTQADFICSAIEADSLLDQVRRARKQHTGALFIYSRFFLHAIDDVAEQKLLQLVQRLAQPGEMLALEFRTWRDEMLRKATPDHYRRYVDPTSTIRALGHAGFEIRYFIEGFGFAKYRSDDAHVCRILASRI